MQLGKLVKFFLTIINKKMALQLADLEGKTKEELEQKIEELQEIFSNSEDLTEVYECTWEMNIVQQALNKMK